MSSNTAETIAKMTRENAIKTCQDVAEVTHYRWQDRCITFHFADDSKLKFTAHKHEIVEDCLI